MVMLPFAGPFGGARSRADDGRDLVDNSGENPRDNQRARIV
jgi:hypothetical protein